MKARSRVYEPHQGNDFLTLSHSSGIPQQSHLPLFVTVESVLPNNETILQDKFSLCESATPKPKSPKTSAQGLTFGKKDCNPYGSDSCAAINFKLGALPEWAKSVPDQLKKIAVTENFDVILLPSFESSQMLGKSRRRIQLRTVRQTLIRSHYPFKKHLEWKSWELDKIALTDINKAYTSKTVSSAGEVIKLGGSRIIKSQIDGRSMNRDLNGARGIVLRVLVDMPWLRGSLNLCIC